MPSDRPSARRRPTPRRLLVAAALAGVVAILGVTALAGSGPPPDGTGSGAAPTTTGPPRSGPEPERTDGRPTVYLLVLDELPLTSLLHEGALNATRFPRFAELAGTSTWYTNWTIHSGRTIHSVPAMLAGVLPRNALATPEEYPTNLFDRLGAAGYAVHAHEVNSWVCSTRWCPDRHPYPEVDHRPGWEVMDEYVAELDGGAWPVETFHHLHLLLPHHPWARLPDGTPYGRGDERNVGRRWPPTPWLSQVTAPIEHLWQLGDTDRRLGQWMDTIRARGEWDDALVIVTADHGQDFTPGHNSRDITADNQTGLVWVPTFVKLPGQREGRVEADPHTATELARIVGDATGVGAAAGSGDHQRVVVADAWPYADGTELTYAPVREDARPAASGQIRPGPGWEGLVDDHVRRVLPPPVADLVGARVDTGTLAGAGPAELDRLDVLEGSERGGCGWDVAVTGNLAGPPDDGHPWVALVVDGTVQAVAPVETPYEGAESDVAARPSYLHLVMDPDQVPRIGRVELLAVDATGGVTGRYDLRSSPHAAPWACDRPTTAPAP